MQKSIVRCSVDRIQPYSYSVEIFSGVDGVCRTCLLQIIPVSFFLGLSKLWYGVQNGLVRRKIWVRIWTESECIVRGCLLQVHVNLGSIVRSVMELIMHVLGSGDMLVLLEKEVSVQVPGWLDMTAQPREKGRRRVRPNRCEGTEPD